jgi:hypothetical protein
MDAAQAWKARMEAAQRADAALRTAAKRPDSST